VDKPLFWLGSSLDEVRAFPLQARRSAGFQQGLEPSDWKWMPAVGAGVEEIRVHTATEHRVFYVARFAEGVYVLHAFEKRSRKTPRRNVELAQSRYRDLLEKRRKGDHGER